MELVRAIGRADLECLALWVRVGANVAVNDWRPGDNGRLMRVDAPATTRGVACHPAVHAHVEAGFAGQVGYDTPVDIGAGRVVLSGKR